VKQIGLAAGNTIGTLFQKAVYTVKVHMKMGETVARNMQSKLKRINKANFVASFWLLMSISSIKFFNHLPQNIKSFD